MSFYPLEHLNRLHDGYQKGFRVNGYKLLLCQLDNTVFIIEDRCPHMDAPLTDAEQLPQCRLRCRAHGIEFDLLTGRACGPLANTLEKVKKYSPIYEGSQIGLDLQDLSQR